MSDKTISGKPGKIHLIGNAHIDPVWLWRWQEGYAEVKATFRSALDRMNEFPEFIFTCACALYYKWVEESEPDMFEEIKQRVKQGRWVIVGGWWIQPDCNLPCGESFVRHSLYSQRYFLDKFGVMAQTGYNVDSFGHSGMLPQILVKSGMKNYVFFRPEEYENPSVTGNLFLWESMDGSRVMAYRLPINYNQYYKKGDPKIPGEQEHNKIMAIKQIAEDEQTDQMGFYGVGNHGGGPTIAALNMIRKLQDATGKGSIIHSSPDNYFHDAAEKYNGLQVYKNDLQYHAKGCYSTQSAVKKSNRKAEHRLMAAEKLMTTAHILLGHKYDSTKLKGAWERVMLNHFHDIMGGCSIKEAYDDVMETYGGALADSAEILNESMQKISWAVDTMGDEPEKRSKEKDWSIWEEKDKGVPVVVYNSLSWPVSAPVTVNRNVKGVADESGSPVGMQIVRGVETNLSNRNNALFMADIPAMGYKTYRIFLDKEFEKQEKNCLTAEGNIIENDFIRLEIEAHTGYIKSLYDKKNDVEILKGFGAVPIVIDIYNYDTWGRGAAGFRDEVAKFSDGKISIIEKGPLRARLRAISRYNDSSIIQDFILHKDRADIEVDVKLDWHERYKMLKLSFPINTDNPKAVYEIPYGFMERPVNGHEEPGQQWVEVTGTVDDIEYGVCLLNDSKYSFDVKDNDLRMTVANSSQYAELIMEDIYNNRASMNEYQDQGVQEFKYALVPHKADAWKNADTFKKAYEFNVKPVNVIETYHKGSLPRVYKGIEIEKENIIATVFKKAQDNDGYILRCFETNGEDTETLIEIPMLKRKFKAGFTKCEIKTFHIPDETNNTVSERNLLEM